MSSHLRLYWVWTLLSMLGKVSHLGLDIVALAHFILSCISRIDQWV